MWKVTIIESERGWGRRVDSIESFETYEEAKKYQVSFNAKNTKDVTPDWYMAAMDPKFDPTEADKKIFNK